MKTITVRIPEDAAKKLRQAAKENCRSLAAQIRFILTAAGGAK